jgi:hypothetical protein
MSDPDHKSIAVVERGETAVQVHPLAMLQHAVENGMDPETIGKLMDLADRHAATEARKAYSMALVDLKRDLPTVLGRDQTVDFRTSKGPVHYTHTSLAAVMGAITEPLMQHGFSLSWIPETEGQTVRVTCRLTHNQGHSEETTLGAPVDRSGSKSDAQGIASTITLLQRYSALSLLGIATADMEEPKGEMPPDHIDSARNMRALKSCIDAGGTKKDVEAIIGKPVAEWTVGDLDKLRAWYKRRHAPAEKKAEPKKKGKGKKTKGDEKAPPADSELDFGPPPLSDDEAEAMRGEAKEEPGL